MPDAAPDPGGDGMTSVEIDIEGMSCGACVTAVKNALGRLAGVTSYETEVGFTRVQFQSGTITTAAIVEAIEDCGFDARVRQPESATLEFALKADDFAYGGQIVNAKPRHVLLAVPGMVCGSCAGWVTVAIEKVAGSQRKTVEVLLSGGLSGVLQILEEIGFPAKLLDAPLPGRTSAKASLGPGHSPFGTPERPPPAETSLLRIRGMSCAACAATAERAARRVPGVKEAAVSVLGHSALLTWAPGCPPNPEAVSAAIRAAGYPTEVVRSGADAAFRVSFLVSGIVCAGCPARIILAVQAVKGVESVTADESTGKVTIEFDPAVTGGPRTLMDKLTLLGYGAELFEEPSAADVDGELAAAECREWRTLFLWSLVFTVPCVIIGMILARVPGTEHGLMFELLPQPPAPPYLPPSLPSTPAFDSMNMTAAAAAALAAAVPVAHQHAMDPTPSPLGGMSPMSGGDMSSMHMSHGGSAHSRSLPVMSVVTWALATPVQFWCGMRFFRGAFRAMRAGVANMDVLVAVGTGAAYGYSALVVLLRALISSASAGAIGDPMFDTPAMLIAFVLLGKWLESVAKGKTQFALRALSDLQPRTATIVSADLSGEREIPAALLQLGDLVKVEPGRRVAVDGLVVSGSVAIDESMLTGESTLVLKEPGTRVVAGSSPMEGSAVVRATAVGASTGIARIVDLVRSAQASKPPIQAAADAVSAVFVPAIVAFSVITFVAWFGAAESGHVPRAWMSAEGPFLFSFLFAIATIVIACPCALGLAVPTVVMVASGLGAANGILFKGGAPLQSAAKVTVVCFDKTGTLTLGSPTVEVLELLPGAQAALRGGAERAAALAAALEEDSPHPIAKAIVAHAGGECAAGPAPKVERRATVLGRGVAGVVDGVACMVGSPAWAEECGAGPLSADCQARVRALEETGHTVLLLCASPLPPGMILQGNTTDAADVSAQLSSGQSSACAPTPGSVSPTDKRGSEVVADLSVSAEARINSAGSSLIDGVPVSAIAAATMAAAGARSADGDSGASAAAAASSASSSGVQARAEADGGGEAAAAPGDAGSHALIPAVAALAAISGPAALFALRDGIKPDARDAITALTRMGVQCVMLTGDNPRAAAAVAEAVGITDVRAALLPHEKLSNLRELRASRRVVAMVGDGVNDAPALAEADVGIAIGAGAEVAVETAGVVLVHSRVKDVPATFQLAAAAMRRIRLNLFLSLVFNGLGVPLAAGILYPALLWRLPPEAAAAAMSISSVSVVLSSLELKRFRSPYFARDESPPAAAAPAVAAAAGRLS